jgi:hypothetical protein
MVKAFISYAHKDRAYADRLATALTGGGMSVSRDTAPRAGEPWADHLRHSLSDSTVVIALMSPEAAQSPYVMSEIGAALAAQKPVVPVILGKRDAVPDLAAMLPDLQPVRAQSRSAVQVADAVRRRIAELDPQLQAI